MSYRARLQALVREWDDIITLGGPGSGHHGHESVEGQRGGSAPGKGGATVAYQEKPDAEAFIAARDRSTRRGYLSPLTPDDLKGQKIYFSEDSTVGGAVTKDGDMGNLFNNGGPKGAAQEVLIDMIKGGGKTADAFEGYLTTLYANFGLQETGRMKFNPEYAPPGWNYERDDNPDVVFLARMSETAEEAGSENDVRARLKDKTKWIAPKRTTKYYDSDQYDQAKRDATAAADRRRARSLGAFHEGPRRGVGGEAWRSGVGGSSRLGRSLAFDLGSEKSGNFGHEGRPGEVGGSGPGGGGGGQVALRPATAADAKRIASLRIPPAYRDAVHLSDDPDADLQATWTDAKGRTQYRYSAEHSEKAAAEKFARLKDFNKALPHLREQIVADLHDTRLSETERESAAILRLIDKTGFRPGSEGETGADTKAYGATTLKAGHVRIEGDKISFRFPSKSGQVTAKTITDPVLAKVLAERKAEGGYLFPNASDADVRDYLHARDGDFKVKDFRTWNGTNKALETMAKMPVPKNDTAFKKAQREVAKKVAKHLGNTPAIALKSYIDPAVFSAWKAKKK